MKRMMKTVLSIAVIVMMVFGLAACSSDSGSSGKSEKASSVASVEASSAAESAEESQPAEETPEYEGDLGDYHVKINDCTFGEDYDGKKIIVIHYDFTNNSDDKQSAMWSLNTKAFQDGIELETAIVMDDDVYDSSRANKEIKPGVTLEDCQIAFVLESESDVEFELSELISFDDDIVTKTFPVE